MKGVGEVKVITQFCFAMEIQESARRLSGNENYYCVREERKRASANKPRCQFASSGQVV